MQLRYPESDKLKDSNEIARDIKQACSEKGFSIGDVSAEDSC